MTMLKSFVAFLDYLGFSDYVKQHKDNPDKIMNLLVNFHLAIDQFDIGRNFLTTVFSDNIVVNMFVDDEVGSLDFVSKYYTFILYLNALQVFILTSVGELPIRGGVSYGDMYNYKGVCFGDAMLNAHQYESQFAVYPRIAISEKFALPEDSLSASERLSDFFNGPKMFDSEVLIRQHFICRDFDNVLFCNYLSSLYNFTNEKWMDGTEELIKKHSMFISSHLEDCSDVKVIQKYAWMKHYHNWFCSPFPEFEKYLIK